MIKAIFFLFILSTSIACASDMAREKRIAEQIEEAIFEGDPVQLTDRTGHSFLSIYTESELDSQQAGVIIMHGRGTHPDWKDVIHPLRTKLPTYGYSTLSIQMPVLDKSAKYYDYETIFHEAGPRIDAAIQFLYSKGINKIIFIAHSCSIHMSMEWLRHHPDAKLVAYIGIGMGATDYKQPMKQPFPLDRLTFPVLDIYGSDDYTAVKKLAAGRLKQIRQAANPGSAQIIVSGSDHDHKDNDQALLNIITGWLDQLQY